MKIQVKATGIELSPAIESYVLKKTSIFEKFLPPEEDTQVRVEVGKTTEHHRTGDVFRAEFFAHVEGKDVRAVATQGDIFAAIDVAKDEFVEALRVHKDKKQTLLRRGGQMIKDLMRGFYKKRK